MDLQWTEDLVQYRQLFDEWCAGQLAILDTNRQQHGQVLAEKSAQLSATSARLEQAKELATQIQQEQQNEEADYRRALEELQQLQAQQDTLPETIAKAKAILQETKQRYELIRQRAEEAEQRGRYKIQELERGLQFYQNHLGLEFRRTDDGCLQFVFTLIDPQDHARPFSFSLKIDSANTQTGEYSVVDCNPSVPNVSSFLALLNRDNNLSAFVCKMRQAFQQIAGAASGSSSQQ